MHKGQKLLLLCLPLKAAVGITVGASFCFKLVFNGGSVNILECSISQSDVGQCDVTP